MKKFIKKVEGFTLVELIVVIAILGILAAVAVPAYTGYIKKANDAAVNTELAAIQTAVTAANATSGAVSKIEVSDDGTIVTVTDDANLATTFAADFKTYYAGCTASAIDGTDTKKATATIPTPAKWENSSYAKGATWENSVWTAKP